MSNEVRKNEDRSEGRGGIDRGRRKFMAALGGAVGGAGAAGLLTGSGQGEESGGKGAYQEKLSTPIVGRHQVVVAGGGISGLIAAVASARSGADTLLIERYPFLGGNGTAGLMVCYNGFRNQREPDHIQTVKGIPAEYIAEIVRLGGTGVEDYYPKKPYDTDNGVLPYCIGFDPEVAKMAALNLIRKEGVKLLLHSWVVGPMTDGNRVTGVIVESKTGREAIAADIVIDATGDGDIAAAAGAPFQMPGEGRMTMSLMYRVGGVPLDEKGPYGGVRKNDWALWWGPRYDGDGTNAASLTKAEVDTRQRLWERMAKIRRQPGKEQLYIMQTATGVGVRETRRFVGEYMLTEEDAKKGVRFPDVIAISSNPIPEHAGQRYFFEHVGFDVPYRSLVPQKVENLVLSGRCISVEQRPFQSSRSGAPAMAIGHASGVAAALSALGDVPPRKLDVKKLQKTLMDQKAELRI